MSAFCSLSTQAIVEVALLSLSLKNQSASLFALKSLSTTQTNKSALKSLSTSKHFTAALFSGTTQTICHI